MNLKLLLSKITFFSLFLYFLYISNLFYNSREKCWNNINFRKMEHILKTAPIVDKSILLKYKKNKPTVYLLSFDNNIKAVFKPNRSLLDQASALRAYYFSQALNLKLVPPTIIRTIDKKRGVVQLFIENTVTDDIENYINSYQKGAIYLFQTILGEFDPAKINLLVQKECDSPALIDNEKNLEWLILSQYQDFPFLLALEKYNNYTESIKTKSYQDFPFHDFKTIKNFSSFSKNNPPYFNLDIKNDRKAAIARRKIEEFLFKEGRIIPPLHNDSLYYIYWKNMIWVQMNIEKFSFLYKRFSIFTTSKKNIKKFKLLSYRDLKYLNDSIKKYFNKKEQEELVKELKIFNHFLLHRRDLILKNYE